MSRKTYPRRQRNDIGAGRAAGRSDRVRRVSDGYARHRRGHGAMDVWVCCARRSYEVKAPWNGPLAG